MMTLGGDYFSEEDMRPIIRRIRRIEPVRKDFSLSQPFEFIDNAVLVESSELYNVHAGYAVHEDACKPGGITLVQDDGCLHVGRNEKIGEYSVRRMSVHWA